MCGGHPEKSKLSWNFIKHHWSANWAANEDPERKHEALLQVVHWVGLFDKFNFFHIHVDCHQVSSQWGEQRYSDFVKGSDNS